MLKKILSNFEWKRSADKFGPKRLVVFVVNSECTKVVVLNRCNDKVVIEETLMLPKWDVENPETSLAAFKRDYQIDAHYCSVVLQLDKEQVRVLNVPRNDLRDNLGAAVFELMGSDDSQAVVFDYDETQASTAVVPVFAASLPLDEAEGFREEVVDALMQPVSLDLSTSVILNFVKKIAGGGEDYSSFFYVGDVSSVFVVFRKGSPVLVRHFGTGYRHVIESICQEFGFNENMALDTFFTNSFDFSTSMRRFTPWFHQLGICMDYVERHLHGRVRTMNVYGLGSRSKFFCDSLQSRIKREVNVLKTSDLLADYVEGEVDDAQAEFFIAIITAVEVMLGGLSK